MRWRASYEEHGVFVGEGGKRQTRCGTADGGDVGHFCDRENVGRKVQGSGFRVQGSGFRVQG